MKPFQKLYRLLLACVLINLVTLAHAQEWHELPEIGKLFEKAGIRGTFVLSRPDQNAFYGYNQQRAEQRFLPASTFKIPNSLIAFETGVVKDEEQIFPYGGQPVWSKAWAQDMNIREAIAVSNVPVYQEIARRIGLERMKHFVQESHYGNADIGTKVDDFWLAGPLKISAIEQVRFLDALMAGKVPFSAQSIQHLHNIMPAEQGEKGKLFFKTGWTGRSLQPKTGWLVGWVESGGKTYTFALNMEVDQDTDLQQRLSLGKEAMKVLGLF